MDTPIADFIKEYNDSHTVRLHVPGHKGVISGWADDITEITGADSLYCASGIIAQSEQNASRIFGCDTFYSAEGSSHCIRAMIYLICRYARINGRKPLFLAARGVHKSFISAIALTDSEAEFISEENCSYIEQALTAESLDSYLSNAAELPVALYITSPDYTGNISDVKALSAVCKKYGVLLAVDCAHGAYLKFLDGSLLPTDLGADICCASAHKTLPALTGAAYLFISGAAPKIFREEAKDALSLFGSTSPSYLILQSLDKLNPLLADDFKVRLKGVTDKVEAVKQALKAQGLELCGSEALKIAVKPKTYGYTGYELYNILYADGIVCEFADEVYLVLMFSCFNDEHDIAKVKETFGKIARRSPINTRPPCLNGHERRYEIKEALYLTNETVDVDKSIGRIYAETNFECPPAVPFIVCGEVIDENTVKAFKYYKIKQIKVI